MLPLPPRSTLFPYTTLFRSLAYARPDCGNDGPDFLVGQDLVDPRLLHVEDLAPQREDRLRSEEHTSELQSRQYLVCRLLLEKKKNTNHPTHIQFKNRNLLKE